MIKLAVIKASFVRWFVRFSHSSNAETAALYASSALQDPLLHPLGFVYARG